jgi:hypothetical protein
MHGTCRRVQPTVRLSAPVRQQCALSAPVVCSGSVSMANSGPHTNRKPVRPPSRLRASDSLSFWVLARVSANASAASGAAANAIESESNARAAEQCADRSSLRSPHSVHSQFSFSPAKLVRHQNFWITSASPPIRFSAVWPSSSCVDPTVRYYKCGRPSSCRLLPTLAVSTAQ